MTKQVALASMLGDVVPNITWWTLVVLHARGSGRCFLSGSRHQGSLTPKHLKARGGCLTACPDTQIQLRSYGCDG